MNNEWALWTSRPTSKHLADLEKANLITAGWQAKVVKGVGGYYVMIRPPARNPFDIASVVIGLGTATAGNFLTSKYESQTLVDALKRKFKINKKNPATCPFCEVVIDGTGVNQDSLGICPKCGKYVRPEWYGKGPDWYGKKATGKKNPVSLYESFHGVAPSKKTKVYYEPPAGELIQIGELTQINYRPRKPSLRNSNEFFHKSGDTGEKMLPTNLILATDKDGKNLYLVRKNKDSKYPVFTDRGIIG